MAVVDDVMANPMYLAVAGAGLLAVVVVLVLLMKPAQKKGHKGGGQGGAKKGNSPAQKKQEKKKKETKAKEEPQEAKDIEAVPSASENEKSGTEAPEAKKKGAKGKPATEEPPAAGNGKKAGKKGGKAHSEKPIEEEREEKEEKDEEEEEHEQEEQEQKKGGKTKSKSKNHHAKGPKQEKPKEDEKAPEPVQEDGIDHSDAAAAGEWETATAAPKKQALRQARKEAEREAEKEAHKHIKAQQVAQHIPGMAAPHVAGSAAAAAAQGGAKVKAAKTVMDKAEEDEKNEPASDASLNAVTIKVPEKKIGHVIGPKGSTLELIKEKSGVTRIDTSGEEFTICGNPKATAIAELAIKEIIEKGYTSLAFENFSSAFVMVHPSFFSELIGKEGCVIRAIKEQLKAEIEIPQGIARTATKKVKVNIAGAAEAVEKAKEVVTDIMTVYHHEVTHPGMVHEEIDIEHWAMSFVIGKKGSEMRHIQSNFKVKLHLPNENSINKRAVIVGEPREVERAKAYIEKLIWNAENQSTGRGRGADGGAEDHWGEEEEHESWMDAYVYKRR